MAKEPEPRITCVNGAVEESCISQQPAGGVSFAISGAPGTAAAVFFCFSRVSACCSDSNGCLFPTSLLAFFPTARNAYYIYMYIKQDVWLACLSGIFHRFFFFCHRCSVNCDAPTLRLNATPSVRCHKERNAGAFGPGRFWVDTEKTVA